MNEKGLQKRTKRFALVVIAFVEELPNRKAYWVIGDQLLRSGTSVGANTRAAYRGRSDKEFAAKIGTVVEEADESLYWLELLEESRLCPEDLTEEMNTLMQEANELTAIFSAIHKKHRK